MRHEVKIGLVAKIRNLLDKTGFRRTSILMWIPKVDCRSGPENLLDDIPLPFFDKGDDPPQAEQNLAFTPTPTGIVFTLPVLEEFEVVAVNWQGI